MQPAAPKDPALTRLISQLNQLHGHLLTLHKILLDHEHARYEQKHGHINSPYDLLQLVINDPFFNWLRNLSGLITQIDEFTSSKDPLPLADGEALITEAKTLLNPDETGTPFQREYFRTIQESPAIALAHANWKRALSQIQ